MCFKKFNKNPSSKLWPSECNPSGNGCDGVPWQAKGGAGTNKAQQLALEMLTLKIQQKEAWFSKSVSQFSLLTSSSNFMQFPHVWCSYTSSIRLSIDISSFKSLNSKTLMNPVPLTLSRSFSTISIGRKSQELLIRSNFCVSSQGTEEISPSCIQVTIFNFKGWIILYIEPGSNEFPSLQWFVSLKKNRADRSFESTIHKLLSVYHIFRDSYVSGMGIVWEAYHKGVPLLGGPWKSHW